MSSEKESVVKCENETSSSLLWVEVRHRAVGARLCDFDLENRSFVVGTGQQHQVILRRKVYIESSLTC